jgi:hypothetical protein
MDFIKYLKWTLQNYKPLLKQNRFYQSSWKSRVHFLGKMDPILVFKLDRALVEADSIKFNKTVSSGELKKGWLPSQHLALRC